MPLGLGLVADPGACATASRWSRTGRGTCARRGVVGVVAARRVVVGRWSHPGPLLRTAWRPALPCSSRASFPRRRGVTLDAVSLDPLLAAGPDQGTAASRALRLAAGPPSTHVIDLSEVYDLPPSSSCRHPAQGSPASRELRIGLLLMLPIASLPAAAPPAAARPARHARRRQAPAAHAEWLIPVAAVLRAAAGDALFANLPLLLRARRRRVGYARKSDGSTGLAALIGYLVFKGVHDRALAGTSWARPPGRSRTANYGVLGIVIGSSPLSPPEVLPDQEPAYLVLRRPPLRPDRRPARWQYIAVVAALIYGVRRRLHRRSAGRSRVDVLGAFDAAPRTACCSCRSACTTCSTRCRGFQFGEYTDANGDLDQRHQQPSCTATRPPARCGDRLLPDHDVRPARGRPRDRAPRQGEDLQVIAGIMGSFALVSFVTTMTGASSSRSSSPRTPCAIRSSPASLALTGAQDPRRVSRFSRARSTTSSTSAC